MNGTIPDSLIRYGSALEEAIRRDLASSAYRRRRRMWFRLVIAGGATAVALGAVSLLVSSTAVPPAAAVIRQAAAALAGTPGTILHVKFTATQDNGDGTTVTWSQESFSEPRPPYDTRLVNDQLPGTPPGVEQATVGGVPQVYDPTRNTIYVGPRPSNEAAHAANQNLRIYRFTRGPTPGTYQVHARIGFVKAATRGSAVAHVRTVWRTVTVTAAQAKALRNGRDVIRWTFHRKAPLATDPRVVRASRASSSSDQSNVDPFSATFRGQILALLRSGHARVIGHATVDGQETVEIQSADRHTTYYVAPETYQPVQLTTRGTTGGVVTHFDTYEELPLKDNNGLLSLTAQHPGALIDRDVADYNAAEARRFPHR
jgi:hypothetical protein